MKPNSEETDLFTALILSEFNIKCVKEYKFSETRKWRFDYAILIHKIAIEVEGGAFTKGRHTRGKGFINDIEKYNNAACDGWILIRTTPSELMSSKTLNFVYKAIILRNLESL